MKNHFIKTGFSGTTEIFTESYLNLDKDCETEMEKDNHLVFKKDSEGSTYAIRELVFKNEIVQFDPSFPRLSSCFLSELPQFPTRPDDIWIIAYPKSGTHWLNEIINLLTRGAATKPLTDKSKTFLEMVGQTEDFEKMQSPRVMNTHLPLMFMSKHIIDNAKIVLPLRNPKSVAVSYFYHRSNIVDYQYDGSFKGFLPDFVQGMEALYGNWFDTVISYWQYLKGKSNVLFVVYEDCKKNPVIGIKELSDFLGLGCDLTRCEEVAKEADFESMRKREQLLVSECTYLKGKEGLCRKGSTTDWKSHFTVAQNEMFDAVYEEKMKDYPDLKEKIKFC